MQAKLEGKVALITGGSRGIGKAISKKLAADGAFVVVNFAANNDAADVTVKEIIESGGRALALQADIGSVEAIRDLFQRLDNLLDSQLGSPRIDILVNNAGVAPPETVEGMDESLYDRIMDVNLKAPYFLAQQVLTRMPDGGRIINTSSLAARQVVAGAMLNNPVYSISKHGMTGLTRNLAVVLGKRAITVNAVEPGFVMTELLASTADIPPQLIANAKAMTALGRFGEPTDIADVVAFLASDDARWVTGQCIAVDGGLQL